LAIILVGLVISGQGMGITAARTGYPTDWSHHHLIFSAPKDAAEAVLLNKNPRYRQQWYRRNTSPEIAGSSEREAGIPGSLLTGGSGGGNGGNGKNQNTLHGEWAESLGAGGTVGAGQFPAKYSFSTTVANCASATQPDYVVYNTGLAGSSSQASIMAFDNLYSGCTGTLAQTYWAYNTGGTALTSPILSEDGTQVAFMQNIAGGDGIGTLVVLKWAPGGGGTAGAPSAITSVASTAYLGCTAPCYTQIPLINEFSDTNSAPFLDYESDTLWVGDDDGYLHEFTGVFKGSPAETNGGGWPSLISEGKKLTSPVQDGFEGLIFVGSSSGQLFRVVQSSGAPRASAVIATDLGIVASPLLDSTSRVVYAFVGEDETTSGTADAPSPCQGTDGEPCNGVFQFSENFAANSSGTEAYLGPAVNPFPLYIGNFNNVYYTSTDATGGLFVCGTDTSEAGEPALFLIPLSGGVMGTAIGGVGITNTNANCSSVTEFYNPNLPAGTGTGTDSIFFSVTNGSLGASCGENDGCVNSAVITAWTPGQAYEVGDVILDPFFDMEIVTGAGTSGGTTPAWPEGVVGGRTTDGSVAWISQGFPTVERPGGWSANHTYAVGAEVIDTHGNLEYCLIAGRSNTGTPFWNINIGGTTTDRQLHKWVNLGPPTANSFETTGGTSGIIVDNAVTTTAGASQIYFSNLSSGTPGCGSGNTCAVQVSQAALQ
jgi:hypothetical protein